MSSVPHTKQCGPPSPQSRDSHANTQTTSELLLTPPQPQFLHKEANTETSTGLVQAEVAQHICSPPQLRIILGLLRYQTQLL